MSMSQILTLRGHFVRSVPTGISVSTVRATMPLNNGTEVSWDVPCLPVGRDGDGLVIVPEALPDGPAGLRVDFSRWYPAICTSDFARVLPLAGSQTEAAQMCRAFDRAPETSWHDPLDKVRAWLHANNIATQPN
jgi:hypothetical protein